VPSRIPIAAQTTDDPIQAWSLSPTVYTLSLESTEQDTLKAYDLSRPLQDDNFPRQERRHLICSDISY